MKNSLQFKLLAAFMLVISVMLGTVLWGISAFFKDQILAVRQHELLKRGMELAYTIQSFNEEVWNPSRLNDLLANADQYIDARIWVLDASGQIIAMSGRHLNGNPPPGSGLGGGPGLGRGPMVNGMGMSPMGGMRGLFNQLDAVYSGQVLTKTMDHPYYGEKMVIVAVPIKNETGDVSGAILLNSSVTGINTFMQRIYYYIALGGLVTLILALLVVNRLTRAIVRPLMAMEQAAGALAAGDYTIRVSINSSDEVGRLGHAFNALATDLATFMAEIEKAEKLRRDFVANVSHELRTPLTILRGYTAALLDGTVTSPDQSSKYLNIMQEETVRLERLVKDLLDLSRLQSETAPWQTEPVPLPIIAENVIHMVEPSAKKKNISLHFTSDENTSEILGNADRLIQLLLILLDNALKHTPMEGRVTVTITQEQNRIILKVADTGIGIAQEDLPYIWDRFYKADKSHTRSESGAGLGLAIAKQIIERHGALVSVVSARQCGSTFTITFPIHPQS